MEKSSTLWKYLSGRWLVRRSNGLISHHFYLYPHLLVKSGIKRVLFRVVSWIVISQTIHELTRKTTNDKSQVVSHFLSWTSYKGKLKNQE